MEKRKIDEIAAELDDISLTLEEIKAEPCAPSTDQKLNQVHATVEKALDVVDRIEDALPSSTSRS